MSSWLTFATKSRRTLSTRRASDTSREKRDGAHDLTVTTEGNERSWSTSRGRAEELQLALRRDPVERDLQELLDRVLGEHLAVAGAVEAARGGVAHDLAADAIDDDDGIGRLVERRQQPVLHRLRACDAIRRLAGGLGDGIDE